MGRKFGCVRAYGPLAGDVRGAQVVCHVSGYERYERLRAFTSEFTSSYERLRAVTSVYEQLRAFTSRYDSLRACSRVRARRRVSSRFVAFRSSRQVARNPLFSCSGRFGRVVFTCVFERARSRLVAFSRVWSRLVAFSRANIFFRVRTRSDTFGHVWACSFVIFRHFSSFFVPKWLFREWRATGVCGTGWGWEGSRLLRMVPAPGAGCVKRHGIHLKSVCSCGRAAAAFVYVQHNCTTKAGRLQFLEFQGASQNGGGFLICSEGQDSQQLSELWLRQSV